jgi:hypothetical protein
MKIPENLQREINFTPSLGKSMFGISSRHETERDTERERERD